MALTSQDFGTFALGMQVFGAIGDTFSAYKKASYEQQGYEYQSQIARNNAQLARWQEVDAVERGVTAQQAIQLRTAQLLGKQEAQMGARNVAMNEGSALNIRADTLFMGKRDQLVVADNAAKEAWGYKNQAITFDNNASMLDWRAGTVDPAMSAFGTALGSAGKVAQTWYVLNKGGSKSDSVWEDG